MTNPSTCAISLPADPPAPRDRPVWLRTMTVRLDDLRVAGGLMLAIAMAAPLVPGEAGLPCILRTLTGVPCPLCGMTTSVRATVRMQLRDAWAANPAGIAAVVVALTLVAFRPKQVGLPAIVLPVTLAAMWVFELFRFQVL